MVFGGIPTRLQPGLEVVLLRPPHRLIGYPVDDLQLHQPVAKKPQAPSCMPYRRLRAGQHGQLRLCLAACEAGLAVCLDLALECRFQTLHGALPAHPLYRCRACSENVGGTRVAPSSPCRHPLSPGASSSWSIFRSCSSSRTLWIFLPVVLTASPLYLPRG